MPEILLLNGTVYRGRVKTPHPHLFLVAEPLSSPDIPFIPFQAANKKAVLLK
jgi:hypothetical protein